MSRTHQHTLIVGLLALTARAWSQSADPIPMVGPPQPTPDTSGPEPSADGGPVIVGTPRESWTGFELLRIDTAVEFRYQSQRDKLRQTGQPDQKNNETRYRELFDLSGEAVIGHRNLLDLTGSIQLGREDIFSKTSPDLGNGRETDLVGLYDLNALVFGSSLLPTDIFARREQNDLNRPFAGSIKETVTEEGIGTRIQTEFAPTSIRYFHRESDLKGDFGNIDSKVLQDSLTLQSTVILTPSQRIEATYTFDRISERQAGGYSDAYDRHDANIVHTYAFSDEARPSDLRSSLRLYDQNGKQSQDRLRWDELLTLRHSDRFETRYNLTFDQLDVRGDTQQLARGEASAKYRLFDSLTSVGTLGAQRLSSPGGFTSEDLFTTGQLDYTKLVPYGRLDAAAGVGFDAQSNSERGSTTHIVGETYTFADAFPIVIARRNIVPGSIVVTPASGFPVYQEGLDYSVLVANDRAEIRGVVGGALTNGQTVKISYDLGPSPGSDVDTTSTNLSVRYTVTEGWLNGVGVYATYRTVDHSLRAKDPSLFTLDDSRDLLLGLEYRYAEIEGRYEYNDHDSNISPYTRHRFQVLYNLPLGPGSALNAEATRELIDFSRVDDRVTFDRASVRWTSRLDETFDVNAGLEYRREDSSRNGQTEGFDQTVGLSWHLRETSITTSFRNSILDGPGSRQTSQLLQFNIRRTF